MFSFYIFLHYDRSVRLIAAAPYFRRFRFFRVSCFSSIFICLDKKGVDTRLQSAQNALLLQEDTIRRTERERKQMIDQITALERQILAMEGEKKQVLVRRQTI